MDPPNYLGNMQRAIDYLNMSMWVYIVDGFAGCNRKLSLLIRIMCELTFHALFMINMLVLTKPEKLLDLEKDNVFSCIKDSNVWRWFK